MRGLTSRRMSVVEDRNTAQDMGAFNGLQRSADAGNIFQKLRRHTAVAAAAAALAIGAPLIYTVDSQIDNTMPAGATVETVNLGSSVAYKFVYINTYDYPGMQQQGATVNWTYVSSSGLGTTTGTCTTGSPSLFNPGNVTEFDGPTTSSAYPLSDAYNYSSKQNVNLSQCEISTIPVSSLNTTNGVLTLSTPAGTNGWTAPTYTIDLVVQSSYSYINNSQNEPLLVTIPLANPIGT